ncbi:hypothetical protein [Sarcina ventriculi]|uniref:hypothetical protein n=1 Tax=Sarcina ventriculi TaxID=1267 RepID=UPI001C0F74C3|nr:hypothetical protein [Sarcina ventriculi]MBU5323395.1 hypothetical protein [Sarcina ventriculi]
MRKLNILNVNKASYIIYASGCNWEVVREEDSGKTVVQVNKSKDTMALADAYNVARKENIALEIEDLIEFLSIQESVRNKVMDKRREFR